MQEGISFYNRYTRKMEREKVLGESVLRWVYGSKSGELSLHLLIKRAFFSQFLGYLKNRPSSVREIAPFVESYGIDMNEALLPIEDYQSFNDFFYRKLKKGARPLCADREVAFPADARHSGWQNASDLKGGFLKGQRFDLPALLGCEKLAARYAEGAVILSRLCPVDYHRFHFPLAGIPQAAKRIEGSLASVSPYCLSQRLSWLWRNKRELSVLDTPEAGEVLLLAVGATAVGSIYQTYEPLKAVEKGDEQGYFAFGGSTVMCFFLPNRIKLADDLVDKTREGIELFARQGDVMGTLVSS